MNKHNLKFYDLMIKSMLNRIYSGTSLYTVKNQISVVISLQLARLPVYRG
jgi:hypothetical protein